MTYAVEGPDTQTFRVMNATNGEYKQNPINSISSTEGPQTYAVPNNSDPDLTYILRVMQMSQTFVDTDEYTYKGLQITVGDTVYETLMPAEPDDEYTYEITPEVTVELSDLGFMDLKVSGCTGFSNITITAVYEEKAEEGHKFIITSDIPFDGTSVTDQTAPYLVVLLLDDESPFDYDNETIDIGQAYGIRIPNSAILTGNALVGVSINGIEKQIEPDATGYTISGIPGVNSDAFLVGNFMGSEGFRLTFEFSDQPISRDIEIHFTFRSNADATKTPRLSCAQTGLSEITNLTWLEDTGRGSQWELSLQPGSAYALDYIQIGTDESTRVISTDGMSLTWLVLEDGAEYSVFLKPILPTIGNLYVHKTTAAKDDYNIASTGVSTSIYEGQRTELLFGSQFDYSDQQGTVTYKLYSGTNTGNTPLRELVQTGYTAGDERYVRFVFDPMPKLDTVTITAQVGEGEIVTKTFDITVLDSADTALQWLSVPTSGSYPTEAKTAISGPNVYGSTAFRNAETGELSLYLAVSGGVMKYSTSGTTDLVWMDGMQFGYYDNEESSGHAIAIGGKDESDLTAFVKQVTGSYSSGLNTSYCLYRCNNGIWKAVSGSALSDAYTFALVLAGDNVWVSDKHWNGTSWTANDITFNSFWKGENGTAYAGSTNGIYRYADGAWTKVTGTSGAMYISSGCARADGSVTLIVSNYLSVEAANQWYDMSNRGSSTINRVDVTGTTASVSLVDISSISASTQKVYVGIAADGTIYAITDGCIYELSEFTRYNGSYLYKLVDGSWIYQNVDAFNNDTDKANIATGKILGTIETPKQRPDGIRRIENPIPGVTVFAGQGGGNYIMFSSATISFDSNGGSAVSPITRTIGSAVTPPTSPTREGFTFSGWYLSNQDIAMGNAPYTWSVMPAADLTLYAKWTKGEESGEDPLEVDKTQAQNTLAQTVGRLKESDYEASVWAQITAAYDSGKSDIAAATTYDGVYQALNNAINEINELAKNTSDTITVAVTVEKLTVDGTYIVEPTLVTVDKYERASVVVTDLLKQYYASVIPVAGGANGNPYRITGTEKADFYLAGVYDPNYNPAQAGNNGQNAIGETFIQNHAGFLSEFDGGNDSGWMYCVNGTFAGVGASAWTMLNGDVLRWQYSCVGLGGDIGNNNSAWGGSEGTPVANKDALIWKVAEINRDGTKTKYSDAYTEAMTVLTTIAALQNDVDAALAALEAVDAAEAQAEADKAAAEAVDAKIAEIGKVTLESVGQITAARAAYDALTDAQKGLVTKLSDLEAAEAEYEALKAAASQAEVDAAAASSVDKLINSIGEVSLKNEDAVTDARAAYDALTDAQKKLVTKLPALTDAEETLAALKADKAAAEALDEKIAVISAVTLDSEEKINEVRAAYDALTAAQKALVTKLPVLAAAEETLAKLKADKAAAEAVEKKISAIGNVTTASEEAIQAARAAYDALTDDQKAQVSNLDTLAAAEKKLATLKADKAAAESVDVKIAEIGKVSLESKAQINAARSAYDALTDTQKAQVTKLSELEAAEAAYKALEEAADQSEVDKAAAGSVDKLIAAIGEVSLDKEETIKDARAAYHALTAAQKALVSKLDTLTAAEEKLAELKNGPEGVTWESALKAVLAYLNKKVTNPSVNSTEGEWAVLALNRGNAASDAWNEIYFENLKAYVDSCGGVLDTYKYTEYSRVILALTAAGVDASEFVTDKATYDLVKPLLDKQSTGAYMAEKQGNNGAMFALLAMNSHDYLNTAEGKAARAALIASLKANQLESGAWSISGKTSPDLDVTAAGIYALAPYYMDEAKLTELGGSVSYAELKTMVDSALAYLSGKQNSNGGFGSVEADVWTIIALSSIGRDADTDPDFVKDGNSLLQDMLSYFDQDSRAFHHLLSGGIDQMATEQAAYGLVAYERFKNSKNALYDMNDVRIASLEEKANQAKADAVDELINAIGEVSLESKAKINAARAAYENLTGEQKTLVSNLSALKAAEKKYKELTETASQEEIDLAAAKGADELIDAIGEVSLESESAIQAARAAYNALTDGQKALVAKADTLEAAEEKLATLKADKAAAKTVDEMIAAIGEVTKDSEEAIKAARAAYDALTEEQKKQVTKLSVLTNAENKLELLNGGSGEDDKKIRVTMRLIGAEIATKDVDLGVEAYLPNYVTWIPSTLYTLDEGATVYDLWVQATWQYGIRNIGAERNYVSTVYAPAGYALSEFSNGRRSGWMYTINGRHPGFGLVEQELHDGDVVIWHYVNDYSYEVADWYSEGQWQALGDGTYYNRWYLAPDYFGGTGGGIGDSNSGSGSDNGSGGSNNNPSDSGSNATVPVNETIYLREDVQTAGAYATLDEKTAQDWLNSAADKENLTVQVIGMVTDRLVFAMDAAAATDLAMTDTEVRVETPKGTFILDQELMDTLAKDGKDVRVIVETEEDGATTLSVLAGSKPVDTTMKVELPAKANSQVLVIVNEDGTEEVIKKSVVEGGKVYAEIPAGAAVKVEENKKEFSDVDDHDWFAEAVDFVSSHELFEGTGKGKFDPKAKMTRAMLVTVLYRLESEPETSGRVQFTDVDADSWYSNAVSWAAENSLVNGTGTGFDPNDNVSREQIATILYRYAKILDLDTRSKGNLSKFGDGAGVSDWAQEAMAWAVDIGLFRGDENGNLNPGGEATRAEVATLLERLIKLIVK